MFIDQKAIVNAHTTQSNLQINAVSYQNPIGPLPQATCTISAKKNGQTSKQRRGSLCSGCEWPTHTQASNANKGEKQLRTSPARGSDVSHHSKSPGAAVSLHSIWEEHEKCGKDAEMSRHPRGTSP